MTEHWYDPAAVDAFGASAPCERPGGAPGSHAWVWRGDLIERAQDRDGAFSRRVKAIRWRCTRCGWWRVLDVVTLRESVRREEP